MGRSSGNTLMAFLVGVATGAMLGILYAPEKGTHTREKLSYQLDKYKKLLQDYLDNFLTADGLAEMSEAKSQGQKVVDEAKIKAEKLLEDVDELLEQIRGKKV